MDTQIDGPGRPGYTLLTMRRVARVSVIGALVAAVTLACAPRNAPLENPAGSANDVGASDVAERLAQATAPDRPLRIVFEWDARERDGRFKGQGVARVEDPYRVRLDLFGPRGESYLTAAAVERNLRLPPNIAPTTVPPAPMLWSVLGVFLPPNEADLVSARADGDRRQLDYSDGEDSWHFEFRRDRLQSVEWRGARDERRTVELSGKDTFGLPKKVVFRDWAAFTELTLQLEEVENVEPYSPDVWSPGVD